jgi:tRNA(Met) cytidine acetyltransferase
VKLYEQINSWLHDRTQFNLHRQLLIISGPEQWGIDQGKKLFAEYSELLWIGNSNGVTTSLSNTQYRQFLGQEFQHVIINCYSGFRANTAIALSGVIRSGGLMVLITPLLDEWENYVDPEWQNRVSHGFLSSLKSSLFIKHLRCRLQKDIHVAVLSPTRFTGTLTPLQLPLSSKNTLNNEQFKAVEAIIKVATGHRNRPLVLSADRGRGKSSALGLAAAALIKSHSKKIIITAPSPATVERVFHHAKSNLPNCVVSKNRIELESGSLAFCAIEELLQNKQLPDLLFIDEAAALPTHLLTQIIDTFPRIVFSTTLHGYEGSGRGFELRVKQYLTLHKPQWQDMHLTQAMRWFDGDYLEALWFELLFMNTITPSKLNVGAEELTLSRLSKADLVANLHQAHIIFQLLINAHYQTSPDDLVRLFDSPEQQCFIIKKGQDIIGVALVIEEGGEHLRQIKEQIAAGTTRVKGHLIAQNIAYQYANAEFSELKQWRITRIAVAQEFQCKGLGLQLINFITQASKSDNIALLSASFGLNSTLFGFWQKAGFATINISQKPEISSAEHSAQLIKPINSKAQKILLDLQSEFYQELLYQTDKSLRNFAPLLLGQLLVASQQTPTEKPIKSPTISQFCHGTRPLLSCKRALRTCFIAHLPFTATLPNEQFTLLVAALMQNKTNQELSVKFKLAGKKEIEEAIRTAYSQFIDKSVVI